MTDGTVTCLMNLVRNASMAILCSQSPNDSLKLTGKPEAETNQSWQGGDITEKLTISTIIADDKKSPL